VVHLTTVVMSMLLAIPILLYTPMRLNILTSLWKQRDWWFKQNKRECFWKNNLKTVPFIRVVFGSKPWIETYVPRPLHVNMMYSQTNNCKWEWFSVVPSNRAFVQRHFIYWKTEGTYIDKNLLLQILLTSCSTCQKRACRSPWCHFLTISFSA
jgi:hypothetical protein